MLPDPGILLNMEEPIDALRVRTVASAGWKPSLYRLADQAEKKAFSEFLASGKIHYVVDEYEEQERELFGVNNPSLVYAPDFEEKFQSHYRTLPERGVWVFYPWRATAVHVLEHDDFYKVRTARNKNLITKSEQDAFYGATIGIAGLSVGNNIALSIVLQGGARHIKLADMDRLALSNTNRVRAGITDLGLLKVELTARQIYELNPYAEIELFPEGLQPDNMGRFFDGLDVVVDELDNIAVKYLIREQAKKHRIPVVMGADNGDNAVIDIERYDEDPDLEFFHGRLGNVTYEGLKNLDKFGIGRTIARHLGPENITQRTLESFLEMGKTIASWPQLGGAAILNGTAVAYCVRRITTKQPLENNRALVSLDEKLDGLYHEPEEATLRKQAAEDFARRLGL